LREARKLRFGAPQTTTPSFLLSNPTMADSGSAQPEKAPAETFLLF
jgi:hypothetical protein